MKIVIAVFRILWSLVALGLVTYSFYSLFTVGISQEFFNFFIAGHVLAKSQGK